MKEETGKGEIIERYYWCDLGNRKIYVPPDCRHPRRCKYAKSSVKEYETVETLEIKIPGGYKIKAGPKNLLVFFILEERFDLNLDENDESCIGKIEKAMSKCLVITERFQNKDGRTNKARIKQFLSRMRKYKGKTFLRQLEPKPKTEIEAYSALKNIMGPIQTFEKLGADIKERIGKGEILNDKISNVLQKKYSLKKIVIDYAWNSVKGDMKKNLGDYPSAVD